MLAISPVRILFLCSIVAVVAACEDPAPVKIGFVGGFEGRNADLAQAGRDGALIAVEEFNKAGGLDGRMVELVVRDDRNDPQTAVRVDEELIAEGVIAILGHMTSEMSLVGIPVANKHQILMLSPTASTNELTGIDDYFLRVYAPNAGDAAALALLAHKHLGVRRVSAAYDVANRAHTETWLQAFSEAFEKAGGEIAIAREFESSQTASLSSVAKDLLVPGSDAVFILAGSLDTGILCQYLRNQGFDGPILASQWSVTPDIFVHAGRSADGIYFIDTFNRASSTPAFASFKKRFENRFSYEPGFAAAFSYEAAMVLLEGLKETTDRSLFKDAILDIREFAGLQTTITFDRFGDVNRPRFYKTIRNGRFESAE